MIIDWRRLLDSIGVPWRDRGSNCVRGNVNIACPFCRNDPSFHLGISEDKEAYYCYRDTRHAGRSAPFLLGKLGIPRDRAVKLLNLYKVGEGKVYREEKPDAAPTPQARRAWDRFESAADSAACMDYLYGRGFEFPELTAQQYDLRYAPVGEWARRILLPFKEDGEIVTWAGRATDSGLEKKYLMEDMSSRGMVYVPRSPRKTLVICEGPIDALKVAVATEDQDVFSLALAGKGMNSAKLLRLARLTEQCENVLVALDADVKVSEAYTIINELAGAIKGPYIKRQRLPEGYKDPGEMAFDAVKSWLKG